MWKSALSLLGLVSVSLSLVACNPAREITFDTRLYGTWKAVSPSSEATPATQAALTWDYLDVNEIGEVRVFAKDDPSGGLRVLGRINGNRLGLNEKAVDVLTTRGARTMSHEGTDSASTEAVSTLKADLSRAKIQMNLEDDREDGKDAPQLVVSIVTGLEAPKFQIFFEKTTRAELEKGLKPSVPEFPEPVSTKDGSFLLPQSQHLPGASAAGE